VWSLQDGHKIRQLTGHTDIVTNGVFTLDSRTVITAAFDNTLRLWDVDYQDWMNTVCQHLFRGFSDQESLEFGVSNTTPACSTQ
jgi:WD40 repeat protein